MGQKHLLGRRFMLNQTRHSSFKASSDAIQSLIISDPNRDWIDSVSKQAALRRQGLPAALLLLQHNHPSDSTREMNRPQKPFCP